MTNTKTHKFLSKINDVLLICAVTALCCTILIFSDIISSGILSGIKTCVNVLIPSLFPFMIISSFIIQSGLSEKIGKIISPITKTFFNLPGAAGATIILSFIGGYPVGANGIESLVQKNIINKEQANRMIAFCVGAGPAFIINVVGNNLLKNKSIGNTIFISQLFASILIGIFLGVRSKIHGNKVEERKPQNLNSDNICNSFVKSCLNSADSLMNMCVFVIIFSSIISLIYNTHIFFTINNLFKNFHIPQKYCNCIIPAILEVTMGAIQSVNNLLPIEFLTFGVSWAGICVHFQVLSSLKSIKLPYHKFVIQRLVHSIISALICHNILSLSEQPKSVFSNTQGVLDPSISSNLNGGINIFLICAIFIVVITLKISSKEKN